MVRTDEQRVEMLLRDAPRRLTAWVLSHCSVVMSTKGTGATGQMP